MNPQHSINEMNTTTSTVPADTRPTKRARGRPKKTNQQEPNSTNNRTNTPMASSSHANVSVTNANSLRDLSELDTALEILSRKVRPSTALAYRQPIAHWKVVKLFLLKKILRTSYFIFNILLCKL